MVDLTNKQAYELHNVLKHPYMKIAKFFDITKGKVAGKISRYDPDEIEDDSELFGEGLGLDSLDAVEIVVMLQRNFNLEVKDMEKNREIFRTISTLADYVYEKTEA